MKEWVQRLKRRAKYALGKDLLIRPAARAETEFHGTEYGGWAVCAGSVSGGSRVYSFGIGEDASFDLSLIAKYGCTCYAFDPTPKSIEWVKRNVHDARFVARPWALGASEGTLRLYTPRNPDFVSAGSTDA